MEGTISGERLPPRQKQHNRRQRKMVSGGKTVMDSNGKIAMDSDSGDGQQQQRNGQRDSKAVAMGNRMAVAQWTSQWVVDDCHQCRSSAIGGNTR